MGCSCCECLVVVTLLALFTHNYTPTLVSLAQFTQELSCRQLIEMYVRCLTCRKDGTSLAALMAELGKLEGLHWIRILYAYPSYFSEDLIDEIANNPKVCKYIDMPLQHMSNLTLLAMNRPPRKHTEDLLWKLKERIPKLALRTTFICGFPGETDAQHEELVSFCKQFGFQRGGAFEYSEEEGTPAASLPDQVRAMLAQFSTSLILVCLVGVRVFWQTCEHFPAISAFLAHAERPRATSLPRPVSDGARQCCAGTS